MPYNCIEYYPCSLFSCKNIKKLLKIPYSKSHVSMAVHRIGRTLLLDELDIQELFMRSSQVNHLGFVKHVTVRTHYFEASVASKRLLCVGKSLRIVCGYKWCSILLQSIYPRTASDVLYSWYCRVKILFPLSCNSFSITMLFY